jgi:outer membrane protein assembly factor BamB
MRIVSTLFCIFFVASALPADDSWWQFRGPAGDGHSNATKLPLKWSEKTNVVWKTPIHDLGWSSPVVWGKQIWLTTATKNGKSLFAVCVDKDTGKVLHDLKIFDVTAPMKISTENSYATPTPVIDESRVYLHYGTYGTACLESKSGRTIWTRQDLNCDHEENAGPASSPTIVGNTVVVHVDGRDVQYVIALDKATGKTVWKTSRSIDFAKVPIHRRKAYSMPMIVPRGKGTQLVSPGAQALYSYDPKSGKELWRVRHSGFSIAPRPVFGHGMVFTIIDRDNPELWAIRTDGKNDVTDSHVQWKESRSMPPRCSPLLVGDLLFLVNRRGIATCLEAKTGKLVWKERLDGNFSASPIYVKDRIYFFNEEAATTVIRPTRKFEILSVNKLTSQSLMATPAIDGNAFIIRTASFLYQIENGAVKPSNPMASLKRFIGKWNIGKSNPTAKPAFVITLNADFSATKSHVPTATGKWEFVNGEARVVWSDGWRDIIRPLGDRFLKVAFKPKTNFDSTPSNSEPAEKIVE